MFASVVFGFYMSWGLVPEVGFSCPRLDVRCLTASVAVIARPAGRDRQRWGLFHGTLEIGFKQLARLEF